MPRNSILSSSPISVQHKYINTKYNVPNANSSNSNRFLIMAVPAHLLEYWRSTTTNHVIARWHHHSTSRRRKNRGYLTLRPRLRHLVDWLRHLHHLLRRIDSRYATTDPAMHRSRTPLSPAGHWRRGCLRHGHNWHSSRRRWGQW